MYGYVRVGIRALNTRQGLAISLALTLIGLCALHTWSAAAAASAPTETFGKSTVGSSKDNGIFANYKVVNSATLSVAGSVTKLSVYAVPGVNSPSPQDPQGGDLLRLGRIARCPRGHRHGSDL